MDFKKVITRCHNLLECINIKDTAPFGPESHAFF